MRLLSYLIPIVIHLLFLPLLFVENIAADACLVEMIIGTVVIPIYLIIISLKFTDKINVKNFATILLLIENVAIIGILISYFNWGISSGHLFSPDSETVYLLKWQMNISSIIIIVGWCTGILIKIAIKNRY